jgi:hypothetical protein
MPSLEVVFSEEAALDIGIFFSKAFGLFQGIGLVYNQSLFEIVRRTGAEDLSLGLKITEVPGMSAYFPAEVFRQQVEQLGESLGLALRF